MQRLVPIPEQHGYNWAHVSAGSTWTLSSNDSRVFCSGETSPLERGEMDVFFGGFGEICLGYIARGDLNVVADTFLEVSISEAALSVERPNHEQHCHGGAFS